MSDDQVTLTIDGRETTVPAGTLVIRAAEELGIIVPRFCDHPLLDPIGACRQCVVEVEGLPKPMMACTTTCTPDMVVQTQHTSEVARKGQEGTIEFLLVNHPLDCPMCDKGGECPLQDQALEHGANVSRFVDEKRRFDKPVAVSEQVLLDRERCVLCARCTRFSEQISGDPFIELFERGALEQVAIYEDEPYESYFSGNVIQICPVGALTSSDYRFKARPFDQRSAQSTCTGCSAGCSLTVQSRRGEVSRQLARTNMATNEMWSCDKGRFGFKALTDATRLVTPMVRRGDDLVDADWGQALVAVADAVGAAVEKGPHRVAVLTGARLPDEDAHVVSKFARTVLRSDRVESRQLFSDAGRSAELQAVLGRESATYDDVEHAPLTLVVGLDPREEVPILFLRLRKAWRNSTAKLVPVGARMGSLGEYAWRRLATDPSAEAGALAALGAALGVDALVDAAEGYASPVLDDVVEAVREAGEDVVLLVGERAGAGALAAAGMIADHLAAKVAWVPRGAGARGSLAAGLVPGLLPGGRSLHDDTDRADVTAMWGDLPDATDSTDLEALLTACSKGEVDVLHLIGVDPLREASSPELAAKALKKVGTVVVQDLVVTDTVREWADVVLPTTGTQEREGTVTDWEGRPSRFRQAVAPPELARDDWQVITQLAGLLGADLGFNDLEAVRLEMEKLGVRAGATAWPAVTAPEVVDAGDELHLLTMPLLLDLDPGLRGADALLASAPAAMVELNAADAERLGVIDGGEVVVSVKKVELTMPVRVGQDVVPGTVFVPANSTEVPGRALLPARKGGTVTVAPAPVQEA
jgi:NADH-quinone oxidoreductase subunit G